MMKRTVTLGMLLALLLSNYGFAQSTRSEEVKSLMVGLESSRQVSRVDSAKIISRSGLQNQDLYVKVADLLKAGYMQEYEKNHADEMSWLCKALAASGDQQYKTLLAEVAKNSPSEKVKKYAKKSSELINAYAERSNIMNSTDEWDQTLSAKDNRLISMLKSDDTGLRRDAAKVIVRNFENEEKVFTAVADALSVMSKDFHIGTGIVYDDEQYSSEVPKGSPLSRLQIDTMSWLCKALAVSEDNKYIKVLEHIHDNTQSHKLRSYAAKAINVLK